MSFSNCHCFPFLHPFLFTSPPFSLYFTQFSSLNFPASLVLKEQHVDYAKVGVIMETWAGHPGNLVLTYFWFVLGRDMEQHAQGIIHGIAWLWAWNNQNKDTSGTRVSYPSTWSIKYAIVNTSEPLLVARYADQFSFSIHWTGWPFTKAGVPLPLMMDLMAPLLFKRTVQGKVKCTLTLSGWVMAVSTGTQWSRKLE